MKLFGFVVLVLAVAKLSCSAAPDPFALDPYDQPSPIEIPPASTNLTLAPLSLEPPVPTPTNPLPPLTAPIEDLFERKYWYLVLLDTKEVFTAPARWDSRDWLILGGLAAGIGTVAVFDEDIEHAIRRARSNTLTTVLDNIQPLGNEYAIGIVGTFYLAGEIFKDPQAKATALDSISASAIASGIMLNSMKYVIGRARPTDGKGAYNFEPFSGQDSFASGHTTEAFALASVITEHYHSPLITFTSYGLAGLVGYARLNNNRHWPSDVLAGATIGTFVGKTVVHFNQQHRRMSVQPIVGPDLRGAELSIAW
jgi:membrane-associated phospholipid phosphatase